MSMQPLRSAPVTRAGLRPRRALALACLFVLAAGLGACRADLHARMPEGVAALPTDAMPQAPEVAGPLPGDPPTAPQVAPPAAPGAAPSPWLSDSRPAVPPEPVAPAAPGPDPGAPPSGALPLPWEPQRPSSPAVPERGPVVPTPSPGPQAPDPWLPGVPAEPPAPAEPPPTQPEPTPPGAGNPPTAPQPTDPWIPGADEPPLPPAPDVPAPAPPQPPADGTVPDPWLPGAGDAPTPAPPTSPAPTPPGEPPADGATPDPWLPGGGDRPQPPAPDAGAPEDPWEAAGGTATPFVGRTPEARAMEQVTRLMDSPGSRDVKGYPPEIVPSVDPGIALNAGARPAVIVFYDDGNRASDLQATRSLPVLVRYRDRVDFIAIDRGAGAAQGSGAEALARMYLDHVPTTVVLDAARKARLYRTGRLEGAALEQALAKVTAEQPKTPAPPVPDVPVPDTPPGLPPAEPGTPPAQPRPGMTFTPPAGYSAKQHAERLRSAPGDAGLPGYPREIVPSAPAGRVLETGHRPIVIIFYDNTVKASDLQAADLLPVLVRRRDDVDIVLVDVGTSARWKPDEKKVVRTYYNFYVPTTVVLASNRGPVRSWYNRIGAKDLERAIDEALGR